MTCAHLTRTATSSNFADDTVILGLIENDETPYFDTINYALQWCKANHLDLNVTKTKGMTHDFRHTPPAKQPVTIEDKAVAKVKTYKYLGCIIRLLVYNSCGTTLLHQLARIEK